MRFTELLRELQSRDIRVFIEDAQLRCEAPRGALSEELRAAIAKHKREIYELFSPQLSNEKKIERIARGRLYPLSFAQQRLWFLHQLDPKGSDYNIPTAMRLKGDLNVEALHRSLNELVRRHEILRTTYRMDGDTPVQHIWDDANLPMPVEDLCSYSPTARADRVNQIASEQAYAPFDLARGPIIRVKLLIAPSEEGRREHVLIMVFHHIVTDDWSSALIYRELATIYSAFAAGRPSPLQDPKLQYVDFAVAQRKWLEGDALDNHLTYWRKKLAGNVAALDLPTRRTRDRSQKTGGEVHFAFAAALKNRLRGLSEQAGYTRFVIIISAFYAFLFRYTGQTDISIGTPIANRNSREVEEIIGFFVNTLVLRAELSGRQTFSALLEQIQILALEAQAHQDLPFERLVEGLGPETRTIGANPLFRVAFVFHNIGFEDPAIPGVDVEMLQSIKRSAVFDLVLHIAENDAGLRGWFEYDSSLFEAETVTRMARHFQNLLECAANRPDMQLFELALLENSEIIASTQQWNATTSAYPSDRCVHDLFEAQAKKTPEAIAVVFEDSRLTYRELDARADHLASRLRHLGVGPDTLVGLFLRPSTELIVAILAILKADGGYVPIDPSYPIGRVQYVLDDCKAELLLTSEELARKLGKTDATVIPLEAETPPIDAKGVFIGRRRATEHNVAYVIYTSGSTGRAKGVMVSHQSVVASTIARFQYYGAPVRSYLLLSSLAFDSSVAGLFWTLCQGGALHLLSDDSRRDPGALARLIEARQISHLLCLPSLYSALLNEFPSSERLSLRGCIVAGEECKNDLVSRHFGALSHTPLYNEYGPTECTVWSTVYEAKAEDEIVACVPIGRPISNARTYVLDKFLAPVPVGVSGELYVGGAGLARGYLRRPDLTAEKFVPSPFGNFGERLYRTGDLARYRQDGNIEYLGRLDHQVKIRGFRVELGEVEAALARLANIREAVVLARDDTPGAARIVAYLVCEAGTELSIGELRASLSNDLPEYMIPSSFVVLDALPLTPNGKADRKALPAPDAAVGAKDYVAPCTPIEEKLCVIWASVLGLERVGVNDNFFELGGHSLLGMTLIERMRREGLPSDVRSLFAYPTPGALSSVLDQGDRSEAPPNLIPDDCVFIVPEALSLADMTQAEIDRVVASVPGGASNVQDIYPLTPLQEGILFHHFISDRGDPYVTPSILAFDTRARLEAFCKGLRAVIARHDVLRTAVLWEGLRDPIQVVWREAPLLVEEVIVDATKGDVAQQLQSRFDAREFRIDVRKAPMLQIFWAQDAVNHRIVLQLFVHHIVLDRAAGGALLDELAAYLSGRAYDMPASPAFRDFVARTRLGASAGKHEAFFSKMLSDVTEPTAPFGMLDVRGDGSNVREQRLQLDLALSSRVRSAARSLKVSVASIWHMAFAHVLARVSGRRDVVFGTVLFGRMHGSPAAAQTVGMFLNTLPIRVRIGAENVAEAACSLHDALIALIAHEHAPLTLAQRCSAIKSPAPLFTALLNFRHGRPGEDRAFEGVTELCWEDRTNYPFVVAVDDFGDGFGMSAQTQIPVDPNAICDCMRLSLERLVTAIETAPETPALAIGVHLDDEMVLSEGPTIATFLRDSCGSPGDRAIRTDELERRRTDGGALMANRAVEPHAPSRAGSAESLAGSCVLSSTVAEAKLVEIWADVLGVSNVGVLDDFFELGGDSLSAMRLVERVRREICGTLTGAALFQAPTVKQLVQLIVGRPTQKPPMAENLPAFRVHPAGGSVMQRLDE